MRPTPARLRLDNALIAYNEAVDALYKAAEAYSYAGVRAMSRQYPRRVVELVSGNGACYVSIEKRGTRRPDQYRVSESGADLVAIGHDWEHPIPEFMQTCGAIEAMTRLPGIGSGCFTFKNGKPLKRD